MTLCFFFVKSFLFFTAEAVLSEIEAIAASIDNDKSIENENQNSVSHVLDSAFTEKSELDRSTIVQEDYFTEKTSEKYRETTTTTAKQYEENSTTPEPEYSMNIEFVKLKL